MLALFNATKSPRMTNMRLSEQRIGPHWSPSPRPPEGIVQLKCPLAQLNTQRSFHFEHETSSDRSLSQRRIFRQHSHTPPHSTISPPPLSSPQAVHFSFCLACVCFLTWWRSLIRTETGARELGAVILIFIGRLESKHRLKWVMCQRQGLGPNGLFWSLNGKRCYERSKIALDASRIKRKCN